MVNEDQPDANPRACKKIRGHAKRLTMGILLADWPYMQKDIAQNTIVNNTNNSQRGHAKRLDLTEILKYLRIGRNKQNRVLLNTL